MSLRSSLVKAEPCLLLASFVLLLFPRGFLPWVGLGLVAVGWLLRGIGSRVWLVRTPLNRPIVALLLMAGVSLYPSVDLGLSMPKFHGILLGFAIYYATLVAVTTPRHFWLGVGLLTASLIAIISLGLVGSNWDQSKAPFLSPVYSLFPQIIRDVQSSFGPRVGINSNELGGTLAFLIPLPLALAIGGRLSRPLVVGLIASVCGSLILVVLAASRSAIISIGISAVLLVIWRWRRSGLALMAVGLFAIGITLSLNTPVAVNFLLKTSASSTAFGEGSLTARLEIWERAVYMIQDTPFTGIGLNTFPSVQKTLYPSFLNNSEENISHAHNVFLQTAVDLGVAGLLAFLGLWVYVAHTGWRAYRHVRGRGGHEPFRAAVVGILLGCLSYLIFGLTDAITLGAKPTVFLWLIIGLLVSIQRMSFNADSCESTSQAPAHDSGSLVWRPVRSVLVATWSFYWVITFVLVGLGVLVIATSAARLGP